MNPEEKSLVKKEEKPVENQEMATEPLSETQTGGEQLMENIKLLAETSLITDNIIKELADANLLLAETSTNSANLLAKSTQDSAELLAKTTLESAEQLSKSNEMLAELLAKTTQESAELLARTTQESAEQLSKSNENSAELLARTTQISADILAKTTHETSEDLRINNDKSVKRMNSLTIVLVCVGFAQIIIAIITLIKLFRI